jgi:hypothetical protein
MSDIYSVKEKMQKMRAKLHPNYLPGYEHTFLARTSNEGAATVADICASMKNRGGYDGDYEDALQTSHHFFLEIANSPLSMCKAKRLRLLEGLYTPEYISSVCKLKDTRV